MIPYLSTEMLVNLMTTGKPVPESLNADHAWHLQNREVAVVAREAWPLRLLPKALRAPIKARLAARAYERTLIRMWETSPHLVKDIGITFAPADPLADHLIAAPAGLVAHVMARGPLPEERKVEAEKAKPVAPPVAAEVQATADHTQKTHNPIAA